MDTNPEFFVKAVEGRDLARAFVYHIGVENRNWLAQNLRYTAERSDGLRWLNLALIEAQNLDRQRTIKTEQRQRDTP